MPPEKRQLIRNVFAHAMAGSWDAALAEGRSAVELFPDDLRLRSLAEDLAARCAETPAPIPPVAAAPRPAASPAALPQPAKPRPEVPAAAREALDKAFLEEARRRLERQGGSAGLGEVVQDSRRISDVLRAATSRHREDDTAGMIEAARAFLAQDLLPEAMRLCQGVLEREPANEQVRGLLMEISRRRGL